MGFKGKGEKRSVFWEWGRRGVIRSEGSGVDRLDSMTHMPRSALAEVVSALRVPRAGGLRVCWTCGNLAHVKDQCQKTRKTKLVTRPTA